MDGIKIEVTGNIARVIERPAKITSGTVGLPVEFTFDSQWDGLTKMAVFRAGNITKDVVNPGEGTTVPWEVLEKPGPWLSIGAYGSNEDGTVVIPTIWANVRPIHNGVDPDGDPSVDPTIPIWQEMLNYLAEIATKPAARVAQIKLEADAWVGSDSKYSQVVTIDGVTRYSKVDLLPSWGDLAIFHNKDVAFVTENDNGVVTVYAIGEKPKEDYIMQVQITEVIV